MVKILFFLGKKYYFFLRKYYFFLRKIFLWKEKKSGYFFYESDITKLEKHTLINLDSRKEEAPLFGYFFSFH